MDEVCEDCGKPHAIRECEICQKEINMRHGEVLMHFAIGRTFLLPKSDVAIQQAPLSGECCNECGTEIAIYIERMLQAKDPAKAN